MNAHVRDNTRYLKGLDGVPTIESGLVIDNTDGDEYLQLPLLSTAECSSVLGAEGKVAFDEQTHRPKFYNGTSVLSQGDLATAFIASQAQGDILYASSATAWARLAKGSAYYYLRMNSGATGVEWATGLKRCVFCPAIYGTNAPGIYGYYQTVKLVDGNDENVNITFISPSDFASITRMSVVIIGLGTGNMYAQFDSQHAADGEDYNNHTGNIGVTTYALTAGKIEEIDVGSAFSGLAAGDMGSLLMNRQGDDANDTVSADVHVIGMVIEAT